MKMMDDGLVAFHCESSSVLSTFTKRDLNELYISVLRIKINFELILLLD